MDEKKRQSERDRKKEILGKRGERERRLKSATRELLNAFVQSTNFFVAPFFFFLLK